MAPIRMTVCDGCRGNFPANRAFYTITAVSGRGKVVEYGTFCKTCMKRIRDYSRWGIRQEIGEYHDRLDAFSKANQTYIPKKYEGMR